MPRYQPSTVVYCITVAVITLVLIAAAVLTAVTVARLPIVEWRAFEVHRDHLRMLRAADNRSETHPFHRDGHTADPFIRFPSSRGPVDMIFSGCRTDGGCYHGAGHDAPPAHWRRRQAGGEAALTDVSSPNAFLMAAVVFQSGSSNDSAQTAGLLVTEVESLMVLDIGVASDDLMATPPLGQRKRQIDPTPAPDYPSSWSVIGVDDPALVTTLLYLNGTLIACGSETDAILGLGIAKYWLNDSYDARSALIGINNNCPTCTLEVTSSMCVDTIMSVRGPTLYVCNLTNACTTIATTEQTIYNLTTYGGVWPRLPVTGPQGPPGPTGPQGPQGANGTAGANGPEGPQGPSGPEGPNGTTGETGPAGPAGMTGPEGPQGPQGINGSMGPEGPAGPNGTQGPQGPQGETGSTGAPGPAGYNGINGTNGVRVPSGMLDLTPCGDGVCDNGNMTRKRTSATWLISGDDVTWSSTSPVSDEASAHAQSRMTDLYRRFRALMFSDFLLVSRMQYRRTRLGGPS